MRIGEVSKKFFNLVVTNGVEEAKNSFSCGELLIISTDLKVIFSDIVENISSVLDRQDRYDEKYLH